MSWRFWYACSVMIVFFQPLPAEFDYWQQTLPSFAQTMQISIDANDSNRMFAATFSGIYRSTDGGSHWYLSINGISEMGDCQRGFQCLPSIRSLAISPADPNVLFAGSRFGRIYKSTNGGNDWDWINRQCNRDRAPFMGITGLLASSANPDIVCAGTEFEGLQRSTDGGRTWKCVLDRPCCSVIADPQEKSTIYAGSYDVMVGGVFRSTDRGNSWADLSGGLPWRMVTGITIDHEFPDTLYASTTKGIYRSTNRGLSWAELYRGFRISFISGLVLHPHNSGVLFVATSGGPSIACSTDRGRTWSSLNVVPRGGLECIAIDPHQPSIMFVGTENCGVVRSTDSGAHWHNMGSGLNSTSFSHLTVDPLNNANVWASGNGELWGSTDRGLTWKNARANLPLAFFGPVLIPKSTPGVLFLPAGVEGIYKSTNNGTNWFPARQGLPAVPEGWNRYFRLAMADTDPPTIYAAWDQLYKTTDGGTTWVLLSTPSQSGSHIEDIWVNSADSSRLLVTTSGQNLLESTDGGRSWNQIWHLCNRLAVDPSNSKIRYTYSDTMIFRTIDGGSSWESLNCPVSDCFLNHLIIDPDDSWTLYYATSCGLWRSLDGGKTFVSIDRPLKNLNFEDFVLDPVSHQTTYAITSLGIVSCNLAMIGDVDLNGSLDGQDYRSLADFLTSNRTVPSRGFTADDISGSGSIDIVDLMVLRVILGFHQ